jgi:DNA invertase Pin-like site-specific DNA recombinase
MEGGITLSEILSETLSELLNIGAAYIRVSDERQDEYSPDSQLKKIREYASREGYLIPDDYVFYDDGISGKSVKKRDDFNRMIAIAKEKTHPFDAIFVWKFSRFARNQEESMVYKNLLKKKGVSVISVSEPIPEGHYGTLIERVIEWMDEFYLVNLGAEVTRGMTEKASRGLPVVAPPYGYVMRDGNYYPDESGPAEIVREVFERYANGEKQRALAMSLGEKGLRTKYGKRPDNRFVDYMLTNSTYIGKIRYSTDGSRAISRRDLTNESIMEVDGKHEPIISKELWDKVQKVYAEQKKQYPKYARREQPIEYMLKGLVRCSNCGGTLIMSSATSGKAKIRTLQCHNYSRGQCTVSHSVLLPKLNNAIVQGLEKAVGEKKFDIIPQKPKKSTPTEVDYDKLISVEERRLARAREAYLAEIDTLEQYKKNKEEITARIAELEAKRDKGNVAKIDVDSFAEKVKGVLEFIQGEDIAETAKNEALHTIIEMAVYEKAKGNLAIYFHDI